MTGTRPGRYGIRLAGYAPRLKQSPRHREMPVECHGDVQHLAQYCAIGQAVSD